MEKIDLILKGVTTGWSSGDSDELIVKVAVNSCTMLNENSAMWSFPELPVISVSIAPFRHLPIDDKHALITDGSSVELYVSGTSPENLKAEVVKVTERKERTMKDFVAALQSRP